jgi:DNA-directed RNA polymerase I subunit RPA1
VRRALEAKFNSSEDLQKLDVELDNTMKSKMNDATSKVLKLCVPDGLVKRFPKNNISAMVLTGAKGGLVNMTQICVLLGQ